MRVLMTTQPAYGHLNPMLPLASALRRAGHDVCFASGARFGEAISSFGFPSRPAGIDWLEADKSGMPAQLRPKPGSTLEEYFTQQFVTATAAPLATGVIAFADTWRPAVIIRETTEFGGAIAAARLGVPAAAVQVGSPSLFTPTQLDSIEPSYNAARAQVGLDPDHSLAGLRGQLVLSAVPPQLLDPQIPLPTRFVALRPSTLDRPVDAQLPAWVDELGRDRPMVYATLGTVFNNPAFELPFFPCVARALEDEPVDVVLTVGPNVDPASLGRQPPNVRVASYLPQSLLFPRCAAVVCHAGSGTLLAAIEHAVPLVVVPFGADQHINARSVERLRIGVAIDPDDLTPQRMRHAVRSVVEDPTAKRNIVEVRDASLALPTFDDAVDIVEGLGRSGAVG